MAEIEGGGTRVDRRSLLRKAAIVGGAAVWTTPIVQSIGGTAYAAVVSGTTNSFQFADVDRDEVFDPEAPTANASCEPAGFGVAGNQATGAGDAGGASVASPASTSLQCVATGGSQTVAVTLTGCTPTTGMAETEACLGGIPGCVPGTPSGSSITFDAGVVRVRVLATC